MEELYRAPPDEWKRDIRPAGLMKSDLDNLIHFIRKYVLDSELDAGYAKLQDFQSFLHGNELRCKSMESRKTGNRMDKSMESDLKFAVDYKKITFLYITLFSNLSVNFVPSEFVVWQSRVVVAAGRHLSIKP